MYNDTMTKSRADTTVKKSAVKLTLKIIAIIIIALLFAFVFLVGLTFTVNRFQGKKVIQNQIEHINALTQYYNSDDFQPVDEQKFCNFDLSKAGEISYQQVRFLATHNSYKSKASAYSSVVNGLLASVADNGWESWAYYFDTITQQLNNGIRSIELDVYALSNGKFESTHHPILDRSGSTINFELALQELAMWSDNNPNHLPITILLEPKEWYLELSGHNFKKQDYANLDASISEGLGNRLCRPLDMLKDFDTFEEMRLADAWPSLEELRGKFIIMLHPSKRQPLYYELDPTLRSLSMFPAYDKRDVKLTEQQMKMVNFAISNFPLKDSELIAEYDRQNFFIRTRLDIYPDHHEDVFLAGIQSKANVLSTDFPVRKSNLDKYDYTVSGIVDNYTVTLK